MEDSRNKKFQSFTITDIAQNMHPAKKKTSKKEKVIINVFVKSSLLEKGKRVDTDIDYKVPKEEVARRERGRGRSRP